MKIDKIEETNTEKRIILSDEPQVRQVRCNGCHRLATEEELKLTASRFGGTVPLNLIWYCDFSCVD